MGVQQTNIFEFMYDEFIIAKPIRLIELFSGIGAQAKALEILGAQFCHWRTCDWAVPSIHAYAAIHEFSLYDMSSTYRYSSLPRDDKLAIVKGVSANYNTPMSEKQLARKNDEWLDDLVVDIGETNNLINIMDVHASDLDIHQRDKYCYVMTYSFPCQDLSLAGLKKGMSVSQADGGTRSGLLWEVERILDECKTDDCLPQVLIMENVPEVVGAKNIKDFQKWRAKLESLGYSNYCEILNAKDYGIPQNRKRCFMVSILGEYSFTFPRRRKLKSTLFDFLETDVDSKYIISQKMLDYLTGINQKESKYDRGKVFERNLDPNKKIAATITTRAGMRATDNFIINFQPNNKRLVETIKNNKIESGDFIDAYNCNVKKDIAGTITTRVAASNNYFIADTLKEELVDKLIEEGKVKEGDCINHSYSSSRMEKPTAANKEFKNCFPAITTRPDTLGVVIGADKVKIRNATKQGFLEAEQGDGVDISTRMHHHRGTVQKASSQTITTMGGDNVGVVLKEDSNLIVRKLTPLECLKLMGFEKYDYDRLVEIGQTDMQIYHEAGDSIVTTVLVAIFGKLLGFNYEPILYDYVDSLKTRNCE